MFERRTSFLDSLIEQVDLGLRTLSDIPAGGRPRPDSAVPENDALPEAARHEHGRLMRINHTGEVCAQALYQGQALVTRSVATRQHLMQAAREEADHLTWCAQRATELGERTSVLNQLFFAGSFALGTVAGLAGDRWSFGFVTETERQVSDHLQSHLNRIEGSDPKSERILETMKDDEERHGEDARRAGGRDLPLPIRLAMKAASKVMTHTTYRW